MPRHLARSLLTMPTTVLLVAVATAAPTAARAASPTTGHESFRGVLVATGVSGQRQVVASPVRLSGVLTGVGRIVEVPNLPDDPGDVARDDVVLRAGTLHLRTVNADVSFALDPVTCRFKIDVPQTTTVDGGTGIFAGASGTFAASVHASGVTARNPDGSCSLQQAPLQERDVVAGDGSLTF